MILYGGLRFQVAYRFPRASRDDPENMQRLQDQTLFSPRKQG